MHSDTGGQDRRFVLDRAGPPVGVEKHRLRVRGVQHGGGRIPGYTPAAELGPSPAAAQAGLRFGRRRCRRWSRRPAGHLVSSTSAAAPTHRRKITVHVPRAGRSRRDRLPAPGGPEAAWRAGGAPPEWVRGVVMEPRTRRGRGEPGLVADALRSRGRRLPHHAGSERFLAWWRLRIAFLITTRRRRYASRAVRPGCEWRTAAPPYEEPDHGSGARPRSVRPSGGAAAELTVPPTFCAGGSSVKDRHGGLPAGWYTCCPSPDPGLHRRSGDAEITALSSARRCATSVVRRRRRGGGMFEKPRRIVG